MNCLDVIFNRKSVRSFIDKEVSTDDLTLLVKAGMAAPSARDVRLWEFIIVTNRELLDELADNLPYAKMLSNAPACIIVCGNVSMTIPNRGEDYWVQDCAAATQNILLAAEALELGAVWTAAFPAEDRVNTVMKALKLPKNIIPLNVIPIGYPAPGQTPKDKWNESKVHINNW